MTDGLRGPPRGSVEILYLYADRLGNSIFFRKLNCLFLFLYGDSMIDIKEEKDYGTQELEWIYKGCLAG